MILDVHAEGGYRDVRVGHHPHVDRGRTRNICEWDGSDDRSRRRHLEIMLLQFLLLLLRLLFRLLLLLLLALSAFCEAQAVDPGEEREGEAMVSTNVKESSNNFTTVQVIRNTLID